MSNNHISAAEAFENVFNAVVNGSFHFQHLTEELLKKAKTLIFEDKETFMCCAITTADNYTYAGSLSEFDRILTIAGIPTCGVWCYNEKTKEKEALFKTERVMFLHLLMLLVRHKDNPTLVKGYCL